MGQVLWSCFLLACVVLFWSQNVEADGTVSCPHKDEVPCRTSSQCIKREKWCDKNEDCDDKSDEEYCKTSSWFNSDPNECDFSQDLLKCDNGICWPVVVKCDGKFDCKNQDDEKDCDESSVSTAATPIAPEKTAKKELEDAEDSKETKKGEESSEEKDEESSEEKDEDDIEDHDDTPQHVSSTTASSTVPSPASLSIPRTTASTWQSSSTKSYYDRRLEQATPHPSVQPPRRTDHRAHRGGQQPSPGVDVSPTLRSSINRYPQSSRYNASWLRPYRRFRNSVPDELDVEEDRRRYNHYGAHPNYYNNRDPTRYVPDPRYRHPNSRNQRYFRRNRGREVAFNRQRKVLNPFHFRTDYAQSYRSVNQASVAKARQWLLGPARQGGEDWGNNTLRALIALSLTGNNSWPEDHQHNVWKKNLNVDLGMQLIRNKNRLGVHRQSQYMLALLATCQDPRDFEGHDLAESLRTEVARHTGQSHSRHRPVPSPLVYLTMCLSGLELSYAEVRHLMVVMDRQTDNEYSRDSSILALEAFACHLQQQLQQYGAGHVNNLHQVSSNAVSRLLQRKAADGSFGSVYSTAIAVQALMSLNDTSSWNPQETFRYLRDQQHADGSFGDFLSTYFALPALAGKSLLHLRNTKCPQAPKSQENELTPWEILNHPSRMFYTRFSLHFGNPLTNAHTIQLLVPKGINFFDVMRVAEYQDKTFRFSAEMENGSMKVFSFSDTPNDPVLGLAWHLYVKTASDPTVLIPNERYAGNIREFLPTPEQHIIYWYHPVTRF